MACTFTVQTGGDAQPMFQTGQDVLQIFLHKMCIRDRAVEARCTVKTSGVTGVEMEALTGVSTALLAIYDICKAVDKGMELSGIYLVEKTGGKSGHYIRSEGGYV